MKLIAISHNIKTITLLQISDWKKCFENGTSKIFFFLMSFYKTIAAYQT